MPPRIRLRPSRLPSVRAKANGTSSLPCRYASTAPPSSSSSAATIAITPAPAIHEDIGAVSLPIHRWPPTQPPSYKLPQLRKSQLHRQYQSLLKSSPLILVFQHNNLKSNELNGIRRELAAALQKIDDAEQTHLAPFIKLQVIQTGIFLSALQVVEFFEPAAMAAAASNANPQVDSSQHPSLTHGLSSNAHRVVQTARKKHKKFSDLEPLLTGPLLLLTLPTISTAHLKSALTILSPSEKFPAPRRKVNPNYHDPAVQAGIQKLMLVGARAEGRVFDIEGARWIGGIEGGLTGLQAQLVAMLQQFGLGVASTLETASKSLHMTLESRRGVLEEEEKPKDGPEAAAASESASEPAKEG